RARSDLSRSRRNTPSGPIEEAPGLRNSGILLARAQCGCLCHSGHELMAAFKNIVMHAPDFLIALLKERRKPSKGLKISTPTSLDGGKPRQAVDTRWRLNVIRMGCCNDWRR